MCELTTDELDAVSGGDGTYAAPRPTTALASSSQPRHNWYPHPPLNTVPSNPHGGGGQVGPNGVIINVP